MSSDHLPSRRCRRATLLHARFSPFFVAEPRGRNADADVYDQRLPPLYAAAGRQPLAVDAPMVLNIGLTSLTPWARGHHVVGVPVDIVVAWHADAER